MLGYLWTFLNSNKTVMCTYTAVVFKLVLLLKVFSICGHSNDHTFCIYYTLSLIKLGLTNVLKVTVKK